MFRCCFAAIILSGIGLAQAPTDLSGAWGFTHFDERFQGWIVIHQSGVTFRGTWHTSKGKQEPDDQVTGRIDGNTITLWRFIGESAKQNYLLTLSADGNHLDGFGDGYFLNHTNLNMLRSTGTTASPTASVQKDLRSNSALDLAGLWTFTHFNDRFQGTITLHQQGSDFTGTWHTIKGKTEPDDSVSARVDGNVVTLWRFIGNDRQSFTLTVSSDRSRLDGYGDGYFLNHTNLSMFRVAETSAQK